MAKNSKEAYKTANDGFLKDMAGKSGVIGKVVSNYCLQVIFGHELQRQNKHIMSSIDGVPEARGL